MGEPDGSRVIRDTSVIQLFQEVTFPACTPGRTQSTARKTLPDYPFPIVMARRKALSVT
jgi:hypothetical protein